MPSGMYTKTLWQFFNGKSISFTSDEFVALLITYTQYTPDLDSHTDINDIPDGAILSTTNVTGKYMDGLNMYADTLTFEAVEDNGVKADAVILYKNGITFSDSFLFHCVDSEKTADFPLILDGTDVVVPWHVDGIIEFSKS